MTLLVDHFVGRAEELGSVDELLGELAQGRGAALQLIGEPGIGKTRLLAELAARGDARGQLVLSGSASELERDLPFSVFVDALDEFVGGLERDRFDALDDDVRTELAHVFPALSPLGTKREMTLQHERYRSHRAVRALLEQLAYARPLVLVLDDLHWADSASLELVGALLRRPPAAAVLLALAVRPHQLPDRVSAAFERASRAKLLTRIELGALSPDEARQLLGDGAARADASVLYEESGGNPFYLEQLARSLDRGDAAVAVRDETSLATIGVPSTVAASLTEELALLSESARLVLEGAAVAGDPFEPEQAAAAAQLPEASVMQAIDELLLIDLLRTTDVPRRFRFRHPLVRRAVYEATAAGWRLGAHERCAHALAARGASASARAHHIERSARAGDAKAAGILRQAGEEAVRLAPASAAHWFAHALRVLPATVPVDERIELLLARARALTAVGRFNDSHDALLDAFALVPEESYAVRAEVARACAAVESLLGRHEQATDRLTRALACLPAEGSREAVVLMTELAGTLVWRAQYEAVHEWADRAVTAARGIGDQPLIAAALAVLVLAESTLGSADRAEANRREAVAIVDSLSDAELARQLEAPARLAGSELYLGRYADGEKHATRALTIARATGQGEVFLVLVATLGGVWRLRGKLAEAGELLDGGIEAARLLGNTHALVWTLLGRSAAALQAGDVELALAAAQEAVDLNKDLDEGFHSAEAAVDLARALLDTGEPERAVGLLVESAGGEELTLIAGGPRVHCLELLTRCWLALDRLAEAERAATNAEARAAALQFPMAVAWASRARAAVDLRAGDATEAATHALAAAAAADEAGAPIEAALSRTLAGRALAEAGESERAADELERAARAFETCGAPRYRDEAEHELRKLGRRIHRRTPSGDAQASGLESLTARELQLARLVVDRKTNPQIAAELFLSQKTVETHLRNIFRKVSVSSRVELARAVERADRSSRDA